MSPERSVSGAVVVVTGAAGGIGAATARLLASRGARLALTDLDGARLSRLELPASAAALRLEHDVADAGAWERVVEQTLAAYGRIDALVNVAGVAEPGRVETVPVPAVERQLAVNLLGTMLGCRAVLGPMRARGAGVVVNVASLGGIVPMPGEAAYCATKHGVRGYSFSLRAELRGTGVRVVVVSPDSVETAQLRHELASGEAPMSFVGPAMAPEVVARAILRALRGGPTEVLVPRATGLVARTAMAFPGLALRLLPRLERRGRANMARGGVARRRGDAAVARRAALVSRRARRVGALEIALALGIAAFWAAFVTLGPEAIGAPRDERVYLAFETAFPVADACLALALAFAGVGLRRGRRWGIPMSLAAGGALVFLGLLDATFNVLQGTYRAGAAQAVGNALIDAACMGAGVVVVAVAGAEARSGTAPALPPRRPGERRPARKDGLGDGAAA